ncbi:MAG TPA: phospholipase D-like domain-containing protein DpdK [Amaricoccus sp.]|uniref:phospholipase D-like domain-containing protein DpdK n=1 Tax=Amaricoccus sp. TaxID=1872485 RepID=UPI002C92E9BD|nr:phospholipase D-like domain-containing protein DpdK [Amaricoccus sp.]HMQ92228.1 phospholipase D-like domain-containing protein DpdK [Amaricoccus sp.]HMR12205.1 phospholipase D-like domain-containing protein DpdK [Arachnia sp.]HMR51684.1 phospholipase D-like domain-containing protein DpdK [Amaricoccus sp.]HMT98380.1 phospholipase D-like domain-containing protein DpdK [Amaricoccus sp.]
MTFETRRIFKSAVTSQNLIRELLQLMLLGGLLAPGGERAWLVSPWISNIVLFDNRAGGFGAVNPEWGSREIRLIEVAKDLMARGTPLGIATSFDKHNDPLIAALRDAVDEEGLAEQLTIVRRQHLHTKGVLLQRGLLTGSMNLTHNGLELNDEMVVYDTSPKTLADPSSTLKAFEQHIARRYPRLFASRRGIRTARSPVLSRREAELRREPARRKRRT